MVGILEAAGWAIVVGCFAQATVSLYGSVQRRAREAASAAEEAELFRRRAQLLLQSDRADRDRTEHSWNGNRKFYIASKALEAKDV